MSQLRNINDLAEVLDLSFQDALAVTADPSVTIDGSVGRSVIAEQIVSHRFDYTNEPGNSLYRVSYENAPVVSAPTKPIYDGAGEFVGYEMQHMIVQGDERAVGTPHCDPLNITPCDDYPTTKNYANEKGKLSVTIGKIPLVMDTIHLKKCLSDVMNTKDGQIFNEVFNEMMTSPNGGITIEQAGDMSETFVRNVQNYIMKEQFLMDRRLSLTDNGLVATVRANLASVANTTVFVDRVDMFANKGEDFAVFRPDPAAELDTNCAVACAQEWQLIGYIQLAGVVDHNRLSAPISRSRDLNGTLMADFALEAGDAIVALGGEVSTINGGNFANNDVILPYWGFTAGQNVGFEPLQKCCRDWGLYGELGLAQRYAAVGLFTGLEEVMGIPTEEFKPFLIPRVIDCCTSPEAHSLNHLNVFDYVDHAKTVLNQAKQVGYLPQVTSGAKIVIQGARRTLEETARSILHNYPTFASKDFNVNAESPRVSVKKAIEIMELELEGIGYSVAMQDVSYGMPEGMIRIGLEKPVVTAVASDLRGYMSEYNQGNWVNQMPDVFVGEAMTPRERMERKQTNVYFIGGGHASTDSMWLEAKLERQYNKFQLLAGADTIIQNVHFRLPDDCPPVCTTKNCEGC